MDYKSLCFVLFCLIGQLSAEQEQSGGEEEGQAEGRTLGRPFKHVANGLGNFLLGVSGNQHNLVKGSSYLYPYEEYPIGNNFYQLPGYRPPFGFYQRPGPIPNFYGGLQYNSYVHPNDFHHHSDYIVAPTTFHRPGFVPKFKDV